MKKYLILILLISLGDCVKFEDPYGWSHEDMVTGIYNNTCIETVNYLYLYITFPDNETFIEEDLNIWVENITKIGEKSYKADIYYLD